MNVIVNILIGKKVQLLIGTLLLITSIVTIRHYSGPIKLVFLFESHRGLPNESQQQEKYGDNGQNVNNRAKNRVSFG